MKKQNRFYLYCGILMLLSELWKQWCLTYILNHGQYWWWYFLPVMQHPYVSVPGDSLDTYRKAAHSDHIPYELRTAGRNLCVL